MTLIGFFRHGWIQWIDIIFIFDIGVYPSIFVMVKFLLKLLLKEHFYIDDSNADD